MSKTLEQEAADLRQQVEAPTKAQERLREIEAQLAREKEDEARKAAEKRAVAISRALGSIATELEEDAERAREAARAYDAAVVRYNERYRRKYEALLLENDALKDRFGIQGAKVPTDVVSPERHPIAIEASSIVSTIRYVQEAWYLIRAHTERCEYELRQRRTYKEIEGTASCDIIKDAGLKPFPELSDAQREHLEERARDAENERRMLATLTTEVARATTGQRIFG